MSRWKGILLGLLGIAAAAACDDGPGQTPQNPGLNRDPAASWVSIFPGQKLGASTAGANALQLCTPEKKRKTWEKALQEPIVPIRGMGGIDGTKNLTYTGVNIDEVEQQLCQGESPGAGETDFGEQGELVFLWSPSTRLVTSILAFSGYRGQIKAKHPTTNETFTVSLESRPIDVNGQPMRWNWRDRTARAANATKLYNALMMALAPERLPKDESGKPKESTNCTTDGGCIATILANRIGAVAIVPLGFLQIYFDLGVDDAGGKDIVTRVYTPIQKSFAFSGLPFTLKLPGALDQEGAFSGGTVGNGKNCAIKPGITYKGFVDNCVRINDKPDVDNAEENKFLAGLTHGTELYRIDVIGVDPVFKSKRVSDDPEPITIKDSDRPEPNDPIQRINFDQQVSGRLLNDFVGESPTGARDNHASGLVNLTYAILVQKELDKADKTGRPKHPIGDPACVLNPDGSKAAPSAAGCTGMEGFLTTAQPAAVPAGTLRNVALGTSAIQVTTANGLKPANNQIASFTDSPTDGLDGINDDFAVVTWAGSARRVIKVLGGGNRLLVPPSLREPRGYAVLWMQALTQYLVARGNVGQNVTLQDVLDAGPDGAAPVRIDPNYFFFDTAGIQQFDSAEYVQTNFATKEVPWYDVHIVVDSTGGILNNISFETYPQKAERLLLSAIGDPTKPIGSDGQLLFTNIFGSSVLTSGWTDPPANAASPWKTAYDCASADFNENDATQVQKFVQFCGAANFPPVDEKGNIARGPDGKPILTPYKGGFLSTGSVLHIGRNVGTLPTDLFTVMSRNPSTQQAKVQIKTKTGTAVGSMGYALPTDATGFYIPIDATKNRFIRTEDFYGTGVALAATLEMIPVVQDLKVVPGLAKFSSVDDNDFMGEIFVCKDQGELLSVRMFTASDVVLSWLQRHPGAFAGCGIILDYWEYGFALKALNSLVNGVSVNFSQPSGVTPGATNTVVSDVDLYAPGQ